jgi:hypothetical protein
MERPRGEVVAISMPVLTPEFDTELGFVFGPKTE